MATNNRTYAHNNMIDEGTVSTGNNRGDISKENSCCESEEEYASPLTKQDESEQTIQNGSSRSNSEGFIDMPAPSTLSEGTPPKSLYQEERMRRKLQFFFMNPIEKWQARRKFPYKFVVQVSVYIN